ncbi:MAG: MBL fold metallo-hydrolase [bacterium]|nr:MBL fold metallo-hydrolase [bacterium]
MKVIFGMIGGMAILSLVMSAGGGAAPGSSGEGIEPARHEGRRFYNEDPDALPGFFGMLKWALGRHPGSWHSYRDLPPGPPPPRKVGPGELRVTFINHSTVLIQMDGLNILTDPVYSRRAGPVTWAGMERVRPPGIRFEDLPPIQVILLSHNHYDHMDMPTLVRLNQRDQPLVLTGLGNSKYLSAEGIRDAREFDWGQGMALSDSVRATFVPAQHFSMRKVYDRDTALWGGFVLEGRGTRVYFAGDTGWGPHLEEIHSRFGDFTLAILPIGAFKPEWFMGPAHMSPRDAARAHVLLKARVSVPIHYGTFQLADDGEDETPEEMRKAMKAAGLSDQEFRILEFGEGRDVPIVD